MSSAASPSPDSGGGPARSPGPGSGPVEPVPAGPSPSGPGRRGSVVVGLVVLGVLGCLVLAVLVGFRWGAYGLAGLLAILAVARATLPLTVIGPLAVRSRLVDVATLVTLAAALAVLPAGIPV